MPIAACQALPPHELAMDGANRKQLIGALLAGTLLGAGALGAGLLIAGGPRRAGHGTPPVAADASQPTRAASLEQPAPAPERPSQGAPEEPSASRAGQESFEIEITPRIRELVELSGQTVEDFVAYKKLEMEFSQAVQKTLYNACKATWIDVDDDPEQYLQKYIAPLCPFELSESDREQILPILEEYRKSIGRSYADTKLRHGLGPMQYDRPDFKLAKERTAIEKAMLPDVDATLTSYRNAFEAQVRSILGPPTGADEFLTRKPVYVLARPK